MTTPTPPRRRWFQFSLSSLLWLMTVASVSVWGYREYRKPSPFAGTQQTAKAKGEWGLTRITMILTDDGQLKMINEIDDEQIVQVGQYSIDGGRFVSNEVDRGATCDIILTGDILVLTLADGTGFRFSRVMK